jgi:hypothetical protein
MADLKEKEAEFEAKQRKTALIVRDDSNLSMYLDTAKFQQMWAAARLLSNAGDMIPRHFQGKPEAVFVVMDLAARANLSPLMMLQNMYLVYGRPGMEAKLVIALVNNSGLFSTSLEFKMSADKQSCYAFATRASDGVVLEGPPVTWQIVKAEGWDKPKGGKDGKKLVPSKWTTLPDLMFRYRAAAFFARLHCPEVLMGLRPVDEIEDIEAAEQVSVTLDPEADVPAFEAPKNKPEHTYAGLELQAMRKGMTMIQFNTLAAGCDINPNAGTKSKSKLLALATAIEDYAIDAGDEQVNSPPPDDDPGPAEFESPAPTTPIDKPATYKEMEGWAAQEGMDNVQFGIFADKHGVTPRTKDQAKLRALEVAFGEWVQGGRE